MGPKISVIIPTYNRDSLIPRAIESVLKQSWENWELIVVDDGSTDATQTTLKSIGGDPRIQYLRSENQGVSAARNLGVSKSEGEWIAFLDSDDQWLPEKLQRQISLLDGDPALVWIHGEEIWVRDGVRVNPKLKHKKRSGDIFEDALRLCCVSPSTVMLRRDLFDRVGGFREDFPVCEDYDLWLKISSLYKVGFVETPIVKKYGGHEDQLSRRFFAMDYWRILALASILESPLDSEKKELAKAELVKKSDILLRGYIKHQNLNSFDEVYKLFKRFQVR